MTQVCLITCHKIGFSPANVVQHACWISMVIFSGLLVSSTAKWQDEDNTVVLYICSTWTCGMFYRQRFVCSYALLVLYAHKLNNY